jgi:hypothetical protein
MQEADLKGEDLDLVSEIYIKQHIDNRSAVLASDFGDRKERVSSLIAFGFAVGSRFYRFDTLHCSPRGAKLAKEQIGQNIRNHKRAIESEIDQIPPRLVDFFVWDCLKDKSSWSSAKTPYLFFDWRQLPLTDDRVWTQCLKLFSILEKYRLSMRTSDYVSTRGGELRGIEFAFPPETYSLLCEISPNRGGLTVKESRPFRLAYLLSDIGPYLTSTAPQDVREFIWQKLNTTALTEADLAQVFSELSKDGITSEWRGLLSSRIPFEIRDQVAFKIRLDSLLVKPSVEELLKAEKVVVPASKQTTQIITSIDDSTLGRSIELYRQIVALESTLRELIKRKLKTQFNEEWQSQIPAEIVEAWKRKERDDLKESLEPERELINYADFSDYAQMIARFKNLFHDVFPNNEGAVERLNMINNICRRRVMHIRTISDEVYYSSMLLIRWVKDQLQKAS